MKNATRRQVLSSVGFVAGTGLLTACGTQSQGSAEQQRGDPEAQREQAQPESDRWVYVQLDPAVVAKKAYDMFPQGGCMYALTGSIIRTLGDMRGEPFRSFPFAMMRYGLGGAGGWGSLCGALNGAAAIIGMFHQKEAGLWLKRGEESQGAQLIGEVFSWYERTRLPRYQPTGAARPAEMPSSVAESVLCHVSLSNWSEVSGHKPIGPQRMERCRRLTADVAIKTVELLNRELVQSSGRSPAQPRTHAGLAPEVRSCISCHGRTQRRDAFGKMSCTNCHTFSRKHPETPEE